MLDNILSFIAPHYCCGCGKIGGLLCINCKNDIISDNELMCISCCRPTANGNLCTSCQVLYERAWLVGKRDGVLQRLIGLYKFQRNRSGFRDLADLLLGVLPELPVETVIIPVPTVPGHVRERGYDHMLLIAKYMAKKRNLDMNNNLLRRKTSTKQRQSSAKQRNDQAKQAFIVNGRIDDNRVYLLIDDVVTTGATLKYASRALLDAGAKHIWVAAIARQTLD